MFLFRVDNKTILYTGDFRIRSNDISKYAQLHKKGDPIKIDVMYVDTTFLTEEHPEFARRSSSVEEMLQKIGKWLEADQCNRVAIHTSATYGYEYVFAKIYKHMGVKVSVDPNTWKRYLDFPNILQVLTTDERDAKIHLCKDIRFKWQCEHNSLRRNRYLSLQLSAASWRHYDEDEKALLEDLNRDYVQVCFATHCSRRELISFVNYFAPGKIVGFPNPYFTSPEKAFNDTYTPTPKKRMLEDPREIEKTDSGSNAVFVKKLF